MIRRHPRSTRTDTLCPSTPHVRAGASAPPPTVDVSVTGLRSERGQILVCLTPNRKAFPDCSKDAGSVRMAVKAADAGHFAVHAPAAGTYAIARSEEHTSELQSLMRISYAVFCLKKKT